MSKGKKSKFFYPNIEKLNLENRPTINFINSVDRKWSRYQKFIKRASREVSIFIREKL